MKETTRFTGLTAATFTPLDEQGRVDIETIGKQADFLTHNGVDGAFVCGTTGEGASLSQQEKISILKTWSSCKGNLGTMFMVGGNCLPDMQELTLLAQKHHYDAISILSPFYFKPKTVEQLVSFCREVTLVAPEMPFYYYHIPGLTGVDFNMVDFIRSAETRLPNLKGIKYSGPNVMDLQACLQHQNGKYDILWGSDASLLAALAVGVEGAVGSTYNYMAPLYTQIISAFKAGDLKTAQRLQHLSVQAVELLVKYGGINAGKAFMKIIEWDCGWCRSPLAPLSNEKMSELRSDLEEIGFFEYCSISVGLSQRQRGLSQR